LDVQSASPYTGDSNYISLTDETKKWQAGYAPYNDTVTLIVMQWEDSRITLGGFSGAWGTLNYTLGAGNKEQVEVWNAQTGVGPAIRYVKIQGAPTITTLSSSLNPSTYGQPVTFTAVVSSDDAAPPDGETVTFMQRGKVLGTGTLSEGSASFTTSTPPLGAGAITAVYEGDAELEGSTSKPVKWVLEEASN
jgi:Bacterial Ig-like domain (group 3)